MSITAEPLDTPLQVMNAARVMLDEACCDLRDTDEGNELADIHDRLHRLILKMEREEREYAAEYISDWEQRS